MQHDFPVRIEAIAHQHQKKFETSSISLSLLEAQSKDISTFATNSLIKVPLLPPILFNYFKFKWLKTFCIRTCNQAVLNRHSNKSLDCFLCPLKFVSWKISAKDTCFLTGTRVCFIYQLEKSPSKGICRLIFENNLSYFIYELFFRIWIISNQKSKKLYNYYKFKFTASIIERLKIIWPHKTVPTISTYITTIMTNNTYSNRQTSIKPPFSNS